MPGDRVCVLGAGPVGLVATKNLTEQGLDVTTFEKQECLGGIWHPHANGLSVLPVTTKNTSKHCSSFTDFPYREDAATHPTAKQVESYLNAYASHFNILHKIHFSTEIVKIERDESTGEWIVNTRRTKQSDGSANETLTFDRIVVASGTLNVAKMPEILGSDKFEGSIIHSRDFKDPSKYEGKRVIVVGVGATGMDTQSFLARSNAKKIYLSHRGQMLLLPRVYNGKAFDHTMSRRAGIIIRALLSFWPTGALSLMKMAMVSARKKAYPSLNSHPSFMAPRVADGLPHRVPMFATDLTDNLASGIVETVQGISKVSGPRSVTLTDGTKLEDIDAIIVCTGYTYDFSFVPGAGNPVDPKFAPDGYEAYKRARFYDPKNPFPRLYRGFISEQYPESLAFLGHLLITKPPFVLYDLATMALASLWSGAYTPGLPSCAELQRDIEKQYRYIVCMLDKGPIPYPGFRAPTGAETYMWLNEVAGTGLDKRLGNWSLAAWKFWWEDRKFYGQLMDGADLPYVYRLLETPYGRKPWPGAKEQILRTHEEIKELGENWKKSNEDKTK
ncbi:Monooxygenase aurF [Paramyrothecium foliicola]|nr:Monooxygenase aurF [Paramyrothecium foliicola]